MSALIQENINVLRRVPLFNELSGKELAHIADQISTERHSAGRVIFSEGDPGGDLLIVKDGSVKVFKTSANGRRQLLAVERTGSSLGEVSIFDEGLYSTTAVASTQVTLLRVRGEHFRALCLTSPHVAFKVIRVLGHRLRHLRRLIEELSFGTIRDRLIAHLLHLAEESGTNTPEGVEIRLEENNEELAARLGTVRELVSRNLGRLHGQGLIVVRRRAVTIPDVTLLQAELQV